jgi:hypothetical protein
MLNVYFTESCLSLLLKHNPWIHRIPPEFPSTPIALLFQDGLSFTLQQFGSQRCVAGVPLRLTLVIRHLWTSHVDHWDKLQKYHRTYPLFQNERANCLYLLTEWKAWWARLRPFWKIEDGSSSSAGLNKQSLWDIASIHRPFLSLANFPRLLRP